MKRRLALSAYSQSRWESCTSQAETLQMSPSLAGVCVCVCLCVYVHECINVSLSVLLCFRVFECELVCRGERVREHDWDRKRSMFLFLKVLADFWFVPERIHS